MHKRIGTLAAALLLLHAGAAHALTVDEIVARYVEARGGAARLAAVRSLRLTGKIHLSGRGYSVEAAWGQLQKRPGQIRSEISLQGLTSVDAFDGKDAWSVQPFQGRRDPQRTSADEAKTLQEDADFEGPLVGWKEKGHQVEYLGTEDVDGTPAHKLRVTLKDGNIKYVFLDSDYFLEIRVETQARIRGVEQVSESDFGSYGQVAGVWFPFTIESGPKGSPRTAQLTIEQIESNVDLDDAVFKLPAPNVSTGRAAIAGPPASAAVSAAPATAKARAAVLDEGVLSGLGARNIGSAQMSGRIAALAARNDNGKTTLYVGAASGGVWKSIDGGTTFKPVFDKQKVQSIGAIAIDPSDPKTVWVGTGETWTRNSASIGDGIYRSTDGGETWVNLGLPNSERIARILIHPKNPAVVYACVPGKLWSDSPDRGLYKTADGGKTWSLVLPGKNLSTGCAAVTMDPADPEVLFASLWDFRRKGWTFRSGGDGEEAPSGSGLLRSADGGKTWKDLDAANSKGLPPKPWGRLEVAIAPSNPKIVYSVIEGTPKVSALYRSDDGGATWERRDNSQAMVWRPFYFARGAIDPKNPERLFKPNYALVVSEDGGHSFSPTSGGAHGDWHDLWIDPENPKHVIGGDDGGLWISFDGGNRWWKSANLPISQFYHVAVDDKDPYQVYGGLQDNSSWVGDSAYGGGITNSRWENLYGGDGFWTVPDPTDPGAVYVEYQGGHIGRVDRRLQAARSIQPLADVHEKLRFNWNAPIHASPTDKNTLYIGAQFLFRSRDRGDTWERISPDLTTNDPEKQKQEQSGGVTVDNSSAEMHTTIYSVSESPLDAKTLWVGTDDGNVQLTRDAGKTWTNLTANLKELPKASWVSWLEASRFDRNTAYAAFDRHTFGDMTPLVYLTRDAGKTWTRIAGPGQGVRGYAHVIREDAVKPGLLFLGTELGLWISVDGGVHWAEFKGGDFPSVAVRDVRIQPRDNDLVLATHGRGLWIVDDLTPLRALSDKVLASEASFLAGRPVQQRIVSQGGWVEGDATFSGQNPPEGAVISYYQRTRHLFGPLKLEVFDAAGDLVDAIPATKRRGINRVVWSMQVKPPRVPRAAQLAFSASQGPRVLPGTYTLRLTKGSQVLETKLEIRLDRRAPWTLADRRQQYEASMKVHALFGDMTTLVERIELTRGASEQRRKALGADALAEKLRAVEEHLNEARKKIVATKEGGAITGEERIREHTDTLYGALVGWEGKPARYQVQRISALRSELDEVKGEVDAIVAKEVRPLEEALKTHKLEALPTELPKVRASLEGLSPARAELFGCTHPAGGCPAPARSAVRVEVQ
jgi:photosystem II stability/assembly factor-like uncharacterized protein